MKNIQSIQIDSNSCEEILPGFSPEFPYIATYAQLDHYADSFTPWHWHRPVELFYIQSGCLAYTTPGGRWEFPAGSGGFVNSNVLHTSTFQRQKESNIQLLHIFDPSLIAGEPGCLIEKKYILPLITASDIEIIPLFPDNPLHSDILGSIQAAFALQESQWGYELELRSALTSIWLKLFALAQPQTLRYRRNDGDIHIKKLMVYIHKHYQQPLCVEELAQIISVSKRACFRLFQEHLHTTPTAYIRRYRLQKACQMLVHGNDSVTRIAYQCGLGSSSYFGKVFRDVYQCTPLEYRRKWHDRDNSLRESYRNSSNAEVK